VSRHRAVRGSSLLVALLTATNPAPGSGQASADRLALAALSDSLAGIHDTTALRHRRSRLQTTLHHRQDISLERVRLGLVSLRLAELGVRPDARDAVKALRTATRERPGWPFAWYALGRAEAQRSAWERAEPLNLGNRVGLKTLERAVAWHRRALEADPRFAPAAVALADLTLELRDTALFDAGARALRRAAEASSAPGEVLLAWGRLERAAGRLPLARRAFGRYLAAGGSRGLGLLEVARTGLAAGDADGDALYYEGAGIDDSASVAGYRADLTVIAADSDLLEFDGARGRARAELLRRFWTDRDRLELRVPGERLREHYRRLLYARRHFGLTLSRRFYGPADAYRSGGMEIDDRGVIYVRHGEPAERLRPFVFGLMPNESWRVARAEGDLLFHFSAGWDANGGGDLYDYRLVESVMDLRGSDEAPRDQLLLSRQSLSREYVRMLNWGRFGAARSAARERGIGRASIEVGTTTDGHELHFAEPLGAVANMVAVGATATGALGHLVFAVAPGGTRPERSPGGVRYAVRVRAVAMDARQRPFGDVDTTIVFPAARALGQAEYLVGRVEIPLPQGLWTWRAALQMGDKLGIVLPRDTVRVAAPGPSLSLSDIGLGLRGASARWEPAPGDTVLLTPFDLIREGSEIEIYYEAAGAREGSSYRYEIAVFRARGERHVAERRPVVRLAFDERAGASLLRSHRTLRLDRLRPGRYLIEVQVRAPDGTVATRRRGFQIVPVKS
jgi:GWxTD domain-containing protein